MPAPEVTENEIRIRVKEPNLFVQSSFRYVDISKDKGIRAVMGKLKTDPQGAMIIQSYRFDKDKWTVDEAVAWVNEHKGKSILEVCALYKEIDISGRLDTKVTKFFRAKILSVDEKNHTIKAVVSTEDIDRDKEINLITSWEKNLDNYKGHPVLLSSHQYNSLQNQIGEATDIKIDKVNKCLIMDFKYYVDEGNKEADWAWKLASKGMAMFSVGYIPVKILEGDAIPEEYRPKEPRRVFAQNELLEVSQVVVGSNRGALQMGIDNPTVEQNQFMFDVVKSFGNDIPDFENEIITAPATVPAVKEPIAPAPVVKEPVITKDSIILEPIMVKDMAEMQAVYEIIKSGRVLSEKNKTVIKSAVEILEQATLALKELLLLTEKPESDKIETDKTDDDTKMFLQRIDATLAKSRQLLKIKS